VNRLVLSLIGVLAGVGLAVAVGAVLFLVAGPGPEHPSPVPTGSDGGAQGPGEPVPEPVPTRLPEPDGGAGGRPEPTLGPLPLGDDELLAGHVVTSEPQAFVYAAPSTFSQVVVALDNGAAVYIVCTTHGETVSSSPTGVSSDLWNYTTLGGYIPDVVVDTGSDQPVSPECPF
jgi:hypothetical protein